jgi:hypothetical protein
MMDENIPYISGAPSNGSGDEMEEPDALLLDPRTESNEQSDAANQLDGYGLFSGTSIPCRALLRGVNVG